MAAINDLLERSIPPYYSHSFEIRLNGRIIDRRIAVAQLQFTNSDDRKQRELVIGICYSMGFEWNTGPIVQYNDPVGQIKLKIFLDFFHLSFWRKNVNNKDQRVNSLSTSDLLVQANNNGTRMRFEQFHGPFEMIRISELYLTATCTFSEPLNPIWFKEARIEEMDLYGFANTSLQKNFLSFAVKEDNYTSLLAEKLDSIIGTVAITAAFNLILDSTILNAHVHRQTTYVVYSGVLRSIEDDLFLQHRFLNRLYLALKNLRNFWHSSTQHHKWLRSLNANLNLSSQSNKSSSGSSSNDQKITIFKASQLFYLGIGDYFGRYTYPNEDFCLFLKYPHKQLVVFYQIDEILNTLKNVTIRTCTLLHLFQFFVAENKTIKVRFGRNFSEKSCDFKRMHRACNTTRLVIDHQPDYFDFILFVSYFELIGPIITLTIVSVFGLVTNSLIIFDLQQKEQENL